MYPFPVLLVVPVPCLMYVHISDAFMSGGDDVPTSDVSKSVTSSTTSSPVVRTKLLFNNHGPINNPTFVILKKTMLDENEIFLPKCLK